MLLIPVSAQAQTPDSTNILGEALVTGSRGVAVPDAGAAPYVVKNIDRATIDRRYEPSLLPVLAEQTPGLFVTQRGVMGYGLAAGAAGGMKVRGIGGAPTTEMLVLIDGHPQYAALMGHTLADAYQSLLAQRVAVVRGPASVRFGSNAMGGVMNIVTRSRHTDGTDNRVRLGGGSYGTLTGEYAGTAKHKRLTAAWAGAYNRTDGHRSNMAFGQETGFGKIGYDMAPHWRAEAFTSVVHFTSQNPGATNAPLVGNDIGITRGAAAASFFNSYDRSSGTLTFFYNWGAHNVNDGHAPQAAPRPYRFIMRDALSGANITQAFIPFGGNVTTIGADYKHYSGRAYNKFDDNRRVMLADRQADEFAGYIDVSQTLAARLTLEAGVRYNYHTLAGAEWIPQGGVVLALPRHARLRAAVSRGFRVPAMKEMYMFNSRNPHLRSESLTNYEIAYSQSLLGGRLRYDANVFYYDATDLIETVPVNGAMLNRNTGRLHSFGVETDASFRATGNLALNANYSYLHTNKLVLAAPRNKLYAGTDYTLGRWNVAGGVQHVGGLYKAATGRNREENFTLLNMRATFRATPFVSLYAKGENLLAQKYETYAGFPMPRATVMAGADFTF